MSEPKVSQTGNAPETQLVAVTAKTGEAARVHAYLQGWRFLKKNGITASQFIEFLRPLANLDGIEVTHVYEGVAEANQQQPETPCPQERQLQPTEKFLSFGLNSEGRVLIQSNFIDLK